jgi:hypothetical protein
LDPDRNLSNASRTKGKREEDRGAARPIQTASRMPIAGPAVAVDSFWWPGVELGESLDAALWQDFNLCSATFDAGSSKTRYSGLNRTRKFAHCER